MHTTISIWIHNGYITEAKRRDEGVTWKEEKKNGKSALKVPCFTHHVY